MIIHAAGQVKEIMRDLFGRCFTYGIYPEAWRKAYIVPLHKKGSHWTPGTTGA